MRTRVEAAIRQSVLPALASEFDEARRAELERALLAPLEIEDIGRAYERLLDEGRRKGGGVYYTPEALVRHLVRRGVVPAFERHLAKVERLAQTDRPLAARRLLEFRVLDPACGSGRFLVAVVDALADAAARFLARCPLPVEDVDALRRLVVERCVFGLDVSPTAVAIARLSLQVAAFAPPSSVEHTITVGNALTDRDVGGFDAVVGNPPWEELTVEELGFYARHRPGLRGLPAAERTRELTALKEARPELAEQLENEQQRAAELRRSLAPASTLGAGDPDLYKLFCRRYRELLAPGGVLAVVLPRSAFGAKGSTDFRAWLFGETTVDRIDFLLNTGRWAFDAEPRYTVALLTARAVHPAEAHEFELAGVADSAAAFARQSASAGVPIGRDALGDRLEVPLLRSNADADVLARIRGHGTPFPLGAGGRWRCFPVAELHETNDRKLWEGADAGAPLWKGESFDQYDPHGAEARVCPPTKKVWKPRPGAESRLAADYPAKERAAAAHRELGRSRVAFRDVTNRTNSRTVIAALVPPGTFLTNKAPYLTFVAGGDVDRAACLGVMNSLAFDWQARRFVETNVNFFILEGLCVPRLDDRAYERVARAAARLSCPDERFDEFAGSTGVETGLLTHEERDDLRSEIDADVAHAYGLMADDLETIFADFTFDAVPAAYRERVRAKLQARSDSRSMARFRILPVGVLGSSSTRETIRGYL